MRQRRRIDPLSDIGGRLFSVEKPARYLGGEAGSIGRGSADDFVMALSFPDLYEIGMSNNAIRILYNDLNALPGVRCERVFAPAPDFEALLAELGIPLFTLEGGIALHDVDLLGFTVGYELAATSLLSILKAGGIPLLAEERGESHPVVLAGGPAISNPGTLGRFIDAAWIGEAEAGFYDLARDLATLGKAGATRGAFLERMAREPAIWMPGRGGQPPKKASRAIFAGFSATAYHTALPLPNIKPVQDHGTVEIMRGCPNGCRFCHAGYYYRPQRMKPEAVIREEVASLVREGGHREITLASLSSGDYEGITELLQDLNREWSRRGVSFQLPSLKVNSFTLPLIEALSTVRKSGLTFAVETPEDAWQRILNKDVSYEKTLAILKEAKSRGFRLAKFYFMIGLPVPERGMGEVEAILGFFDRLAGENLGMSFNVNVGTFVPKPHTPFQWSAQLGEEEAFAAIQALRSGMRRHRNVKLSWHSPFLSALEGVLSRGDERVGDLILAAFQRGARLDAWEDRFDRELWRSVLADSGWDPFGSILSERDPDEALPWDSVGIRVSKTWLRREWDRAQRAELRAACMENCTSPCGSCADDLGIVKKTTQAKAPAPAVIQEPRPARARLVLAYAKSGSASFIPHLGVVEAFSRAIMMLDLPAAYSEGFNPLPRLEFVAPLPMGVDAGEEVAVLLLRDDLDEGLLRDGALRLIEELNRRLPRGLVVQKAAISSLVAGRKIKSIGALSWGGRYSLHLLPGCRLDRAGFAEGLARSIEPIPGAALVTASGQADSWELLLPDSTKKGHGLQPLLATALGEGLREGGSPRELVGYRRDACLGRLGDGRVVPLFDVIMREGLA